LLLRQPSRFLMQTCRLIYRLMPLKMKPRPQQ
jgi:hypothetical protein